MKVQFASLFHLIKWSKKNWEIPVFTILALAPWFHPALAGGLGGQITSVLIIGIAALGLNVMVGFTGLLHLGIASFFGLGGLFLAVLTVPMNPLEIGFLPAVFVSVSVTAAIGTLLGSPTLRLRGEYLAIVTLGFGEVVRALFLNLENVTGGPQGLGPIPPPGSGIFVAGIDLGREFVVDSRWFYYLSLIVLFVVVLLVQILEKSALGRAWIAVREEPLAAATIGISATKVRLSAFTIAAGIAGLAGCQSVASIGTTGDPNAFGFNRSVAILCAVIIGGLGSIPGTLVGVTILFGFDIVVIPWVDSWLQRIQGQVFDVSPFTLGSWRLALVGIALIVVMRFRPVGLIPSRRFAAEFQESQQ